MSKMKESELEEAYKKAMLGSPDFMPNLVFAPDGIYMKNEITGVVKFIPWKEVDKGSKNA